MAETLAALILALGLQVEVGHAAYYAAGVMEQVVRIRQAGWTAGPLPKKLPPIVGFVALADCGKLGELVWLFHESEGFSGPHLVADCANHISGHDRRMKRLGIVCEVGWNTASRWGVIGRGPENIWVAIIGRQ